MADLNVRALCQNWLDTSSQEDNANVASVADRLSTAISGVSAAGVITFAVNPVFPGGGPLTAADIDTSAELRAILTDETGSGAAVFATSPTLVTPILGTPTSGTLTNATGLPISTGVSGLGTGVATALAVNTGSAGALVVNGGALGTPSSGTLTNATGLPISTGVSGLAANVATALATPSSANVAAAVTDETGSGALVFATSPTLVTPALGTPASGTLTNCTGYPSGQGASMILLKANSGTTTNAAAENVDTQAISGLTAKDTLVVYVDVQSDTQNTAGFQLYNATDSVTMRSYGTVVTTEAPTSGDFRARQGQQGATTVNTYASLAFTTGASTGVTQATFTTAWTGSWTLALRHTGVVAGGTFRWSWAVYKIAGQ